MSDLRRKKVYSTVVNLCLALCVSLNNKIRCLHFTAKIVFVIYSVSDPDSGVFWIRIRIQALKKGLKC